MQPVCFQSVVLCHACVSADVKGLLEAHLSRPFSQFWRYAELHTEGDGWNMGSERPLLSIWFLSRVSVPSISKFYACPL